MARILRDMLNNLGNDSIWTAPSGQTLTPLDAAIAAGPVLAPVSVAAAFKLVAPATAAPKLNVMDMAEVSAVSGFASAGTLGSGGFGDGHAHSGGSSGGIRDASTAGISEVMTYTYDAVDARYEYTGNQLIDGALFGSRWTVTNLTYSFPTTGEFYNTPYYDPEYTAEQVPFNAAQQAAAIYAFGMISSYTNLTFTQVTESADTHGIIRMSQTTASGAGSAEGNFPGSDASDGDIWFGQTGQPFYLTPAIGNWGMATVIHEIGHTMGLKHGHDNYTTFDLTVGGYLDGPGPHYGTAALPSDQDGWAWSVMTYRSAPGFTATFQGEQFNQPQTYMQADIAALQFMYGANFTSNATNSVYTFDSTTGQMFINGVGQGVPEFDAVAGVGKIFRTIWDGDGIDTYDFSNFTDNQVVDLRAGAFSTFSLAQLGDSRPLTAGFTPQPGNIGNALLYNNDLRSLIENAIGGSGNDVFIGNQASNTFTGNAGNDTYILDSVSDAVVEAEGGGTDFVVTTFTYTLSANVENLTLATTAAVDGTGNDLANVITGGTGYNYLYGLGGDDLIIGSTYVPAQAQTLNESALPQHDTIATAVNLPAASFGLNNDANIAASTTAPHTTVTGTGDGFYDMYSFTVDAAGVVGTFDIDASLSLDSFVELFDAGGTRLSFDDDSSTSDGGGGSTSGVDAFLTYTFTAAGTYYIRVGKYSTSTTSAPLDVGDSYTLQISLAGNTVPASNPDPADGGDFMEGGDGNDTLLGGAGDDILDGGAGNDSLDGGTWTNTVRYATAASGVTVSLALQGGAQNTIGAGIDTLSGFRDLTGSFHNDSLTGDSQANLINGLNGADTMAGGLGDDTYWIESAGDNVVEASGAGIDAVISLIDYSLAGKQIENLFLAGGDNLNGTGNGLSNTIVGNSGNNGLTGAGGHDQLLGADGNDILDGGAGNDTLTGGLGNDTFVVDAAGDQISEAAGQGSDEVRSSITFTLAGKQLENLTLLGTGNINGTGNGFTNILIGNSGNNALDGGTNHDSIVGGAGNDTLLGGTGNDTIIAGDASDGTDSVEGGDGNDVITSSGMGIVNGGIGNDYIYAGLSNGDEIINGGDGNDTIDGSLFGGHYVIDLATGLTNYGGEDFDNFENAVTGEGNDTVTGTAGGNWVFTSGGNDSLDGAAGNDTLVGGEGNDTYVIDATGDVVTEQADDGNDWVRSSVSYTLSDNVETLELTGSANTSGTGNALNNTIYADTGNNTLIGLAGDDFLDGGAGADSFVGGLGNDVYVVTEVGDVITELSGEGSDYVFAGITYTLGANLENLTLVGVDNINGTGNALANDIFGNSGNNVLTGLDGGDFINGNGGADTMVGGNGDDAYVVDNAGDVVTELSNQGTDTVFAGITYSLVGKQVENINLTGALAINASGNSFNNILNGNDAGNVLSGSTGNDTLNGNGGNDSLVGGAGVDQMFGGLGDDTFVVDDIGDQTLDVAGTDTVQSTLTWTLAADLENLTLTGAATINGTGNEMNNALTGNVANNTLTGLGGNDLLSGGGGTDTLVGGLGDDTYVVDDATDVVTEISNQGTDEVQSAITYTLVGRQIENLTLTGLAAINATGNSFNNVLNGNAGANILSGSTGNDTLNGGGGNDSLVGGTGADSMSGGLDDDTYVVDDAGDVVMEITSQGTDTILSSLTYSLAGKQVENLTLTGAAALNATGNSLANVLTGNGLANTLDAGGGHDRLDGSLGADTMIGGTGNDTYVVDNAADTVTESPTSGTDLVESSLTFTLGADVENLTLTGSAAINGTGNGLNNVLTGNDGNNILTGGLGDDTYYIQNTGDNVVEVGGQGTDTIFSTVTYSLNGRFAETIILTGSANINATGNSLGNTLTGNDGINTINGKGGADILTGGLGADIFLFETASGTDTVTDFSAAQNDTINVNAYTGGVANNGLVTQSGLNVIINLGGGNVITVNNALQADVLTHMVW